MTGEAICGEGAPGMTGGVEEFVWKGRTGPWNVLLAPGVFRPTHTSLMVADAIEIEPDDVVVDAGCGSGVLAFVAARLGAERVVGTDISPAAIGMAGANARRLGLDGVVEFRLGNLFEPVADLTADVVIGDVSGIPDAIAAAAGWIAGGGPSGVELPVAMLEGLGPVLRPGGRFYLPTGSIHDEERLLAVARKIFGEDSLDLVSTKRFPLPSAVAGSPELPGLMADGVTTLERQGSRLLWDLRVWCCHMPG